MPRGAAGLLIDAGTAELVAYILKYDGCPAGSTRTRRSLLSHELPVLAEQVGAAWRRFRPSRHLCTRR